MPTALQIAIESENPEALRKVFRKSKANPDWLDEMGLTPLHYAAYFGKRDIVKRMLALGADANFRIAKYDSTPLQWATYCGIKNAPKLNHVLNRETILELLDGGAVYDIMSAVANEDLARIKRILKARPGEVDSKWMNGFSPLHVNNNLEIGEYLLRHKAGIHQRSEDGTTPLVYLCNRLRTDVRIAALYIEHGADVNARNDAGRTALHGAVRRGHDEIVNVLLKAGAKKSLKDKKGRTAR
jgi:ankyrin repeat protein